MNVMTIILSTTASLLVAALILSWQNSNSGVKEEAETHEKRIADLNRKIKTLKDELRRAKNATSGGASITEQTTLKNKERLLEAAEAEKARTQDQMAALNATKTEPVTTQPEVSTSALDAALRGDAPASEKQLIDSLGTGIEGTSAPTSANSDQRRRQKIRDSKVYANIVSVTFDPDGDLIYGELTEGSNIAPGSILAVRRNQIGIAGLVKIVDMFSNGSKEVLSLEVHGNQHPDFVIEKGDELILRP